MQLNGHSLVHYAPGDELHGAWTREELEAMNARFAAALEAAFAAGLENRDARPGGWLAVIGRGRVALREKPGARRSTRSPSIASFPGAALPPLRRLMLKTIAFTGQNAAEKAPLIRCCLMIFHWRTPSSREVLYGVAPWQTL